MKQLKYSLKFLPYKSCNIMHILENFKKVRSLLYSYHFDLLQIIVRQKFIFNSLFHLFDNFSLNDPFK